MSSFIKTMQSPCCHHYHLPLAGLQFHCLCSQLALVRLERTSKTDSSRTATLSEVDSQLQAMHSNPNFQKFNYLKAQLQSDAACVVAGFPLTNDNYEHSVLLLKQRFGQSYKPINAHMQALLNLQNLPATIRVYKPSTYDTAENHTRGLSLLGKSLNKLSNKIKKNLKVCAI